jgi:beta-lactamase class D
MMRKLLVTLPVLAVLFSACSINNVTEDNSLQRFFDSAGVKGCFALYDNGSGRFTIYNLPRYRDSGYAPGATFDIPEVLIGLQTGRLPDEKVILAVRDTVPITLAEAFQSTGVDNEAVAGKLTELIGHDSLKRWVDSLHYGNQGLDKDSAALRNGHLTIPADQQLGLIKRLYFNQLPFFKSYQETVRALMRTESNSNYKLVYKTAIVPYKDHNLGWVLGWVEENKHPYFFALNLDATDPKADAAQIGVQLVKHILPAMGFFQGKK